ncbi:DUF7523 family protein [Halosimplex salinum]|uniref:DUF7523 family protein n=1 Tax=Halosimplex salinum TaxID=1710538 RepID=UPI000F47CFAA|nr:hypothetical protein [Halosimplex salinum]
MTLAADTREAVRRHPFLHDALRAGVVNYSAAARFLDVDGETDAGRASASEPSVADAPEDAVVAALRRYAEDLPDYERPGSDPPVSMQSGLGEGDPADALLVVGDLALVPDSGSLTAITAGGDADAAALRQVLGRLETAEVSVEAAAVGGDSLVVVVERRAGPDALRAVEDALAA